VKISFSYDVTHILFSFVAKRGKKISLPEPHKASLALFLTACLAMENPERQENVGRTETNGNI